MRYRTRFRSSRSNSSTPLAHESSSVSRHAVSLVRPTGGQLPLWASLIGTALMTLILYGLVLLKNRLLARYELRGPFRILAPVVR